ncbi:hypothetical protein HYW76_00790 [Candidatus Pacearchaeota archaeon]|nr:hypothetical protein [Candidatus Pacearchaeota archaeon]
MLDLTELKKLNFPIADFAIFGSAPLSIRGIRESKDIDLIVRESLWKELSKKYPVIGEKKNKIEIGNIELWKDWLPWFDNSDKLIDDAEIIQRLPFIKLKYIIEWKKKYNREKDRQDLKLIEKYLKLKHENL